MKKNRLNIVLIGSPAFPEGSAITKRRRYIVDYLNSHNISCHVLVTGFRKSETQNPNSGFYDKTEFVNISHLFAEHKYLSYFKKGKKYLKTWYDKDAKNILLFSTLINFNDNTFYKYATKLGYYVVFDIVETAFWKYENLSLKARIHYFMDEYYSKKAYKKSAAFVISERLMDEFRTKYPNMPLCILPNATPLSITEGRKSLNNPLQVLYAGTYAAKEGVTYLIDGVKQTIEKGCKCKLLLLGKAPQALREKYANDSSIDFKGFVSEDDLARLQAESDVLAMVRTNSIFANFGFPFKLTEYLATGNIVLSTRVSDVEKYLTDKQDAYIIEPENATAVCNAIMHIAKNPEEACRVAQNGLKTAEEKFSIEVVGKTFEEFLLTL